MADRFKRKWIGINEMFMSSARNLKPLKHNMLYSALDKRHSINHKHLHKLCIQDEFL